MDYALVIIYCHCSNSYCFLYSTYRLDGQISIILVSWPSFYQQNGQVLSHINPPFLAGFL